MLTVNISIEFLSFAAVAGKSSSAKWEREIKDSQVHQKEMIVMIRSEEMTEK